MSTLTALLRPMAAPAGVGTGKRVNHYARVLQTPEYALWSLLKELGITPFTPWSVRKYKWAFAAKQNNPAVLVWHMVLRGLYSCVGSDVAGPFPVLGSGLFFSWAGYNSPWPVGWWHWVAIVIPGVFGLVIAAIGWEVTMYWSRFHKVTTRYWGSWSVVPLGDFGGRLPSAVQDLATRLGKQVPGLTFHVHQFVADTEVVDPFLTVSVDGGKTEYYIAVWGEPDFRIAQEA